MENPQAADGGLTEDENAMNNPAYENLLTRRSVRKYLPQPVAPELLNAVLTAGAYAPSGSNRQDNLILVVQDETDKEKLRELNHKYGKPGSDPFYGAPVVTIVFSDSTDPNCRYNGALVMGNMLNAAHALGLAGRWINRARQTFEDPEGQALLKKWGVEGSWEGIGYCILGYPDGPLPAASPRREGYIRFV